MSVPIQIPQMHRKSRDFDEGEFAYSYNPSRYDSPIYNYPNRVMSHSCPIPTTGTSPICPDKRVSVLHIISPNDTESEIQKPPTPKINIQQSHSHSQSDQEPQTEILQYSFMDIGQDKTNLPRELLSELIKQEHHHENTSSFASEKVEVNVKDKVVDNVVESTYTTTSSMDEYMIAYISSSESDESGDSPKSVKVKTEIQETNENTEIFKMDDDEDEDEEKGEHWPFTDQTFEDIALYLWNKQEQDDMKEQEF